MLVYHNVADGAGVDACRVSIRTFAAHMEALRRASYLGVSVECLLSPPPGAPVNVTPVGITFDDGYQDFRNASAIMAEAGFLGTVFLITGRMGRDNGWDDARADRHMHLTWDEARALRAAGFCLGSHTVTHPDLRRLSDEQVRWELGGSADQIEAHTGVRPVVLAYPYGRFDRRVVRIARDCGYRFGVRADSAGLNTPLTDPYLLHRMHVLDSDSAQEVLRKARGGGWWRHPLTGLRRVACDVVGILRSWLHVP